MGDTSGLNPTISADGLNPTISAEFRAALEDFQQSTQRFDSQEMDVDETTMVDKVRYRSSSHGEITLFPIINKITLDTMISALTTIPSTIQTITLLIKKNSLVSGVIKVGNYTICEKQISQQETFDDFNRFSNYCRFTFARTGNGFELTEVIFYVSGPEGQIVEVTDLNQSLLPNINFSYDGAFNQGVIRITDDDYLDVHPNSLNGNTVMWQYPKQTGQFMQEYPPPKNLTQMMSELIMSAYSEPDVAESIGEGQVKLDIIFYNSSCLHSTVMDLEAILEYYKLWGSLYYHNEIFRVLSGRPTTVEKQIKRHSQINTQLVYKSTEALYKDSSFRERIMPQYLSTPLKNIVGNNGIEIKLFDYVERVYDDDSTGVVGIVVGVKDLTHLHCIFRKLNVTKVENAEIWKVSLDDEGLLLPLIAHDDQSSPESYQCTSLNKTDITPIQKEITLNKLAIQILEEEKALLASSTKEWSRTIPEYKTDDTDDVDDTDDTDVIPCTDGEQCNDSCPKTPCDLNITSPSLERTNSQPLIYHEVLVTEEQADEAEQATEKAKEKATAKMSPQKKSTLGIKRKIARKTEKLKQKEKQKKMLELVTSGLGYTGGANTEKIFKITDGYCIFNGDILDFSSPVDDTLISKVVPSGSTYVQSCNEYIMGQKLKKYSEFLVAEKCEIIKRGLDADNLERDEFIFEKCGLLVSNTDTIEVNVYKKSGKDLQFYMDNPDDLHKLLTRNKQISPYDGINMLIIYFMNILSILQTEKIIHKDIKPGNIIVGDDLYNFPKNIKIIDLGFSFEYEDFTDFTIKQKKQLYGDESLVLKSEFSTNLYDRDERGYYTNLDDNINIFNVITGVATPEYAAPEFDLRLSSGFITPTIASMICPDPRSSVLEIRNDIPQYIIQNQYDVDYTQLAELYLTDTKIKDDENQNLVKDNMINKRIIQAIIEYNSKNNTKYNLFEILYLLVNGITGPEPILYKYDLYAFGLILRHLVDSYIDALEKNLIFDPRKYRAKTKKNKPTKRPIKGGTIPNTFDYQTRINYKELDDINYVVNNMINKDCIYRWSLDDLMSFYQGLDIETEKFINIKGNMYKLCSEEITKESIINQFQIINPELKEYVKPKPTSTSVVNVDWDSIRTQLKDSGMNARKIGLTITKMKRKGLTSIDEL